MVDQHAQRNRNKARHWFARALRELQKAGVTIALCVLVVAGFVVFYPMMLMLAAFIILLVIAVVLIALPVQLFAPSVKREIRK